MRDFGGICVLAVNMAVLRGHTGTHTLTVALKEFINFYYYYCLIIRDLVYILKRRLLYAFIIKTISFSKRGNSHDTFHKDAAGLP